MKTPLRKKLEVIENHICIECACVHNPHNISFDTGEFIMGNCTHKKYSILLSQKACKFFKKIIQSD